MPSTHKRPQHSNLVEHSVNRGFSDTGSAVRILAVEYLSKLDGDFTPPIALGSADACV